MKLDFNVQNHAIERYSERVLGLTQTIDEMTHDVRHSILEAIAQDMKRVRLLDPYQNRVMMSRLRGSRSPVGKNSSDEELFGQKPRRKRRSSQFITRCDTDFWLVEDRVYFERLKINGEPTRIIVSMLRLNPAQLDTITDLGSEEPTRSFLPQNDQSRSHSDVRIVSYSPHIVINSAVSAMLSSVYGWSHARSIQELRAVLSDRRTRISHKVIDRALKQEISPGSHRFVLHADANILFGISRRSPYRNEQTWGSLRVDEVILFLILDDEELQTILSLQPLALFGGFKSIIEAPVGLLLFSRNTLGWSYPETIRFLIREFRDSPKRIPLEQEPYPNFDLHGSLIECFETNESYLWFSGSNIIDFVLKKDAEFAEHQRSASA